MENAITQGPNEAYEHAIDYTGVLGGDTILSSAWASAPAGLVHGLDSNTPSTATLWISGGVAGEDYTLTNTVITAGGRTFERWLTVRIRPKAVS
jgi:hypothetical protein